MLLAPASTRRPLWKATGIRLCRLPPLRKSALGFGDIVFLELCWARSQHAKRAAAVLILIIRLPQVQSGAD
eukprot:1020444-Pelagomonas_calceolata.AAC.1